MTDDAGTGVERQGRVPDPIGWREAQLVRARVPDEVRALRERLERLRLEQADNREVLDAIDEITVGLDELTVALVRDMLGVHGAPRRLGHRSSVDG